MPNISGPGPLTLLLPKADVIPDLVTSGLDRVGIRCPDHPLTLDLLNTLAFPLAAPSANPFGYISPTRASHVNDQLGDSIDYILDGGPCPVGIESTIVGFEGEATLIYRMGGISIESIESTVGAVIATNTSSESPQAPGQLKSHYAPRKRLMLGNMVDLISAFGNEQVGILSWQKIWPGVEEKKQIVLSPSGDLSEAAQRLFLSLRELDRMDVTMILAEEVPDIGLGRAINDRLRRAAVTAEDT